MGPENKEIQATRANPPILLLIGFAITMPKDQVNAPASNNKTPTNLPSKLGAPNKTISPTNAIIIPRIFFISVLSFNKK